MTSFFVICRKPTRRTVVRRTSALGSGAPPSMMILHPFYYSCENVTARLSFYVLLWLRRPCCNQYCRLALYLIGNKIDSHGTLTCYHTRQVTIYNVIVCWDLFMYVFITLIFGACHLPSYTGHTGGGRTAIPQGLVLLPFPLPDPNDSGIFKVEIRPEGTGLGHLSATS